MAAPRVCLCSAARWPCSCPRRFLKEERYLAKKARARVPQAFRRSLTSLRHQRRRASGAELHVHAFLITDGKAFQQVVDDKQSVMGRIEEHAVLGLVCTVLLRDGEEAVRSLPERQKYVQFYPPNQQPV